MSVATIDCRQFDARLSDYLENTISLPMRAAVDGHVASCARCSAVLADVRSIVDRAAALPALKPSRDLWSGIEARLETPVVSIDTARPRTRRVRVPAWVGLAAAAAVLIVVTSVVTRQWVTSGDKTAPNVAATPTVPTPQPESLGPAVSPVSTSPTPNTAARERVSAAVTYAREIARLETFVRQRGEALDPTTKAIVENSMRIIDSALVEARAALARDPASRFLTDQVDQTLQKKMELLRTVSLLAART